MKYNEHDAKHNNYTPQLQLKVRNNCKLKVDLPFSQCLTNQQMFVSLFIATVALLASSPTLYNSGV
jgi:hypothetical protein